MRSHQYYNVYHSSEALEDIYHTFHKGKIHAKKISIYAIEEYNRFTKKWTEQMNKAVEHADLKNVTTDGKKIILTR